MQTYDIAVIGAGIAGASVAAKLAQRGKHVALLEMESQAGYHTTGRSAAVFAPSYGPSVIRALARASKPFFSAPPENFTETPLFSPRLIMMLARTDQMNALDTLHHDVGEGPHIRIIDEAALRNLNPLIRSGYAHAALIDGAGQDIDVSALHQGFLRQFKNNKGKVILKAEVQGLARNDSSWAISTTAGNITAGSIVNAAGAWADVVSEMAGAEKIGLIPKRRTAAMIATPNNLDASGFPITMALLHKSHEGFTS